MTIVAISEDYIKFSGHAKESIVCHGISAITHMVANYVLANGWGKVNADDGYLAITEVEEEYRGNVLFQAMIQGIKDISEEYPGNIEIKYV